MEYTHMQSLTALLLVGSLCLISCEVPQNDNQFVHKSSLKHGPETRVCGTDNLRVRGTANVYKSSFEHGPETRVRGTANLGGSNGPILDAIAPRKKSLISKLQPKLYFCVTQASTAWLEVTVNSVSRPSDRPLFEKKLPPPSGPKIYEVLVGNIEFKANEDYEWRVAWVFNERDRSQDIIAGGDFRYQPLSATEEWCIYAARGYWYDAIAALYKQRCDSELREQWASLLKQEKLEKLLASCDPCDPGIKQ